MRSVSARTRVGMTLLTVFVVLAVPTAFADDDPLYEPPQARIRPPVGTTTQARVRPPSGEPTTGAPSTDARIKPPIGVTPSSEPSFFELFADWLVLQARIRPPIG